MSSKNGINRRAQIVFLFRALFVLVSVLNLTKKKIWKKSCLFFQKSAFFANCCILISLKLSLNLCRKFREKMIINFKNGSAFLNTFLVKFRIFFCFDDISYNIKIFIYYQGFGFYTIFQSISFPITYQKSLTVNNTWI